MARFLFSTLPLAGHLGPNLAVARRLRERGHEVMLYSGASAAPKAAARDLAFTPFRALDEAALHDTIRAITGVRFPFQARPLWRRILIESVEAQLEDLEPLLDSWQPDLIICDPLMWGPILVLHEREPIPVAIQSYVAACMLPGEQGPMLGLSLPPARGPVARGVRRGLRWLFNRVAVGVRKEANQLRARHGLPPIDLSVTGYTGRLPLYLMPGSRDFDYNRSDLPGSVHYVGLLEWNEGELPPRPPVLDRLAPARPLVYVTEGTVHARKPHLLRAAVEGLGELPINVILTTGTHRTAQSLGLGTIPANIHVEQWVSHRALFPHVDLVVTTGGSGTVLGALAEGVPLIISPTDWDQPENAWRVAEAGAGLRIAPRDCTAARLRDAVQLVLAQDEYRQNAARLATSLHQQGGADQAVNLLVATARTSLGHSPSRQPFIPHPLPREHSHEEVRRVNTN